MPSNGTMNPSNSRYGPWQFRSPLYALVGTPHAPPHRVSSTGLNIFHNMPSLLPRKIARSVSVIRLLAQRPSPHDHRVGIFSLIYEATSGFTFVTACCFANWELTTPCYQNAAPLNYRGERIIPQAGLQPARYPTVTAYGQVCCWLLAQHKPHHSFLTPYRYPFFALPSKPRFHLPQDQR